MAKKKYRVKCNSDEIIEAEDDNDACAEFREILELEVEEISKRKEN